MGDVLSVDTALNQPFVSESYDRLMRAQRPAPADVEAIGNRLRTPINDGRALGDALSLLGVSQQQLADRLGMGAPVISNMKNDRVVIDTRTDLAIRALLAMKALG